MTTTEQQMATEDVPTPTEQVDQAAQGKTAVTKKRKSRLGSKTGGPGNDLGIPENWDEMDFEELKEALKDVDLNDPRVPVDLKNKIERRMKPLPKFNPDEWVHLSRQLEAQHSVFYAMWTLSRPMFTWSIPTAACTFDKVTGRGLKFLFNPEYWEKLTDYDRLFLISHECLHLILNHGVRGLNFLGDPENQKISNIAMDLAVNHSLIRSFGFEREKLGPIGTGGCFTDTVFKKEDNIPDDLSFENYYVKIMEKRQEVMSRQGYKVIDVHISADGSGSGKGQGPDGLTKEQRQQVIDATKRAMNPQNQKDLGERVKKLEEGGQKAGTGVGDWAEIVIDDTPIKKKWETIIREWDRKTSAEWPDPEETWVMPNFRVSAGMPPDCIVPAEYEVQEYSKNKIDLFFFLDTSGSCYHLKERFFTAAKSLNPKKFNLNLVCFDTQCYDVSLKENKVYGGGGTAFDIIENRIQEYKQEHGCKYPKAVFIITDGYGSQVQPEKPKNWHWFLTEGGASDLIPSESHIYELQNFE